MGRRRLTRAADTVVAALVLLLTVPSSVGLLWSAPGWVAAAGGVCVAVLVAALLARRRYPWQCFWASCAALLGLVALPSLPEGTPVVFLPVSLVYLLVLHAVVADSGRWRLPLAVSLVGLGLIVGRTLVDAPGPLDRGTFWVLVPFVLLLLGGSCVLGARDFERRRAQSRRLAEAVARERELMAREVHDVVAHSLAVVVAQADAALLVMDSDPQRSRAMVSSAVGTGREAMAQMRRVVRVLRDGAPASAPVRSLHDLEHLVASSRTATAGLELVVDGDVARVGPEVARAVYRIVQESLTNAVKHATRPPRCRVEVSVGGTVVHVTVSDDGAGLATSGAGTSGLGLAGIRERARSLGGRVEIASDASGTRVSAWLPTA